MLLCSEFPNIREKWCKRREKMAIPKRYALQAKKIICFIICKDESLGNGILRLRIAF